MRCPCSLQSDRNHTTRRWHIFGVLGPRCWVVWILNLIKNRFHPVLIKLVRREGNPKQNGTTAVRQREGRVLDDLEVREWMSDEPEEHQDSLRSHQRDHYCQGFFSQEQQFWQSAWTHQTAPHRILWWDNWTLRHKGGLKLSQSIKMPFNPQHNPRTCD